MTLRCWIDTDVGTNPDDAVALRCAMAHPGVELVGVSTVDGATERRAEQARRLVQVPVVAGHRRTELVDALGTTAPDALLAIGPLTNVATLLDAGYGPRRLAVMGGALHPVRHRGVVRAIEHNFAADPSAAQRVLAGIDDVLVVPLDVSARMRLTDDERAAIGGAVPELAPALDDWIAHQLAAGVPAPEVAVCLHDPLALLALVSETVVRLEPRRLAVESDGRLVVSSGARRHQVVVDVARDAAVRRVVALLGGGLVGGR